MRRAYVVAVICAAAISACGSASDSVTFQAPPSYESRASIGPFVQVWETPNRRSAMILMQLPTQVDLDRVIQESNVKDADVRVNKMITICGKQRAVYAEMTGTTGGAVNVGVGNAPGSKESRSDVDFLGTNVGGRTYLAMYVRPIGTPTDPAAEAAIHNVCPK
jgi:hypothetical protein